MSEPYRDPNRDPLGAAHRHSSLHRTEILKSDRCRCFYCLGSFTPQEIQKWVDRDQTALCPKCGIDSVIGSASEVPLDDDFFSEMKKAFF